MRMREFSLCKYHFYNNICFDLCWDRVCLILNFVFVIEILEIEFTQRVIEKVTVTDSVEPHNSYKDYKIKSLETRTP